MATMTSDFAFFSSSGKTKLNRNKYSLANSPSNWPWSQATFDFTPQISQMAYRRNLNLAAFLNKLSNQFGES